MPGVGRCNQMVKRNRRRLKSASTCLGRGRTGEDNEQFREEGSLPFSAIKHRMRVLYIYFLRTGATTKKASRCCQMPAHRGHCSRFLLPSCPCTRETGCCCCCCCCWCANCFASVVGWHVRNYCTFKCSSNRRRLDSGSVSRMSLVARAITTRTALGPAVCGSHKIEREDGDVQWRP